MAKLKNGHQLPMLSFGLIADVHYADIDDGTNYSKTRKRFYRNSLNWVKSAVDDWNSRSDSKCPISFVLDLGDLIDGFNVKHNASSSALETVLNIFEKVKVPVFHIWGNHDFYNFTRKDLFAMPKMNPYAVGRLKQPSDTTPCASYFDFELCRGYRLVAIDTYEVSMLGIEKESPTYRIAEEMLRLENKNEDLNSPVGLRSNKRQFVMFNGAVSDAQLKWLDGVLTKSEERGEVVLVAGHCPLSLSDDIALCWNYAEILGVFYRHRCVLAYFAGHAHDRWYAQDERGIHHLTIPGVIEVDPCSRGAHCTVDLYEDRIAITDVGAETVREFCLNGD